MKASTVLRLSLGVTFLWIGIMIVKDPVSWVGFLQDWFVKLLPFSPTLLLTLTGYLDIVLGGLFLLNFFTPYIGIIGTIHMALILISSGVNETTVRDIAIGGACFSLFLESYNNKNKVR